MYNKAAEGGLMYNDPQLVINWQLPESELILSDKDLVNPLLKTFHKPHYHERNHTRRRLRHRLYPITKGISKQIMPVYDKPMIYYPLSVLMLAGISEVLIITTPEDSAQFQKLLGDGASIGCKFSYAVQEKPNGLAQAFVIGEEFIGNDKVALVLGDNIFYGPGFSKLLQSFSDVDGAAIFAYEVSDPERYGVVDFDENFKALSIEEKPVQPKKPLCSAGFVFLR